MLVIPCVFGSYISEANCNPMQYKIGARESRASDNELFINGEAVMAWTERSGVNRGSVVRTYRKTETPRGASATEPQRGNPAITVSP
jgi:hypothetical protein